MTVVIIVSLFALWNLELLATLLNLKAFPSSVPDELNDVMDSNQLTSGFDYLRTHARFDTIQATTSLTTLLVFWCSGGFTWLDGLARSLSHSPIIGGLIFLAAIFVGQSLLTLPFDLYETFIIEKKFGFNRITPTTFVIDRLKGLLLAAVIGLPLAAAILWIFHSVTHAWIWAWLVVTITQLILAWLAPTLIMPLFNQFTPMPDGDLKQQIHDLGNRCGFPLDGVFIMDGSKRSTKANAFFTGFGKRKKIALFDTLVDKSSTPELLGVLAHEIGHFRKNHIKQRLIAGIFQTAIIFFLLGMATSPTGTFSRLLFDAFNIRDISPHVGLVLFAILMEPIGKLLGVMTNAWSRRHEFEADAYAADATGDPTPLATALKRMTADHLSHPSPCALRVWLDYSHPPLLERLRHLQCHGKNSAKQPV